MRRVIQRSHWSLRKMRSPSGVSEGGSLAAGAQILAVLLFCWVCLRPEYIEMTRARLQTTKGGRWGQTWLSWEVCYREVQWQHIRCQSGCGTTGTLIHCWWECKLRYHLRKRAGHLPYKIRHKPTIHPSNLPLGYLSRGNKNSCSYKKKVALFIVPKTENKPNTSQQMIKYLEKWTLEHPGCGILFSNEMEGTTDTCGRISSAWCALKKSQMHRVCGIWFHPHGEMEKANL